MHSHSRPLDIAKLSTPHSYKPIPGPASTCWWGRFNDPQLNQLIEAALVNSPDMRIAESRVRQAQQLAQEATSSLLWPSVDLSGYLQRQRFSQTGLIPPPFNGKTFNIGDLGLNFNYDLDFWGKNRQTVLAQINEACAMQAELAQARLVISSAVANSYFQLRGTIAQVKITNEYWHLNEKLLQIVTNRSSHGVESDIPVKTLQANIQAAKISYEQYKQVESLIRHQLVVLIGENPLSTQIETKPFIFKRYHVSLPACLPANLLANRPDIYAARTRVEAAANQVNVAKARFFPDINLSMLFSYQSIELGHLFSAQSQNNAITGAFDLPIFDAGARRANLGVKYAEYDMAVNEYNQTILSALREVADEASTLHGLNAQLAAQGVALAATQRNYKLYNLRYNHGIADYVQVLESKQSLLERQSSQLDLQTRQLQAIVGMLKALGGNDLISKG